MQENNYLIIDFSQIVHKALAKPIKEERQLTREDILAPLYSTIRYYQKKFPRARKTILAIDSNQSWRKSFFPYYKANRKVKREASNFDWVEFYKILAGVLDEFHENTSFIVLRVEGAEGDDIIATLTKRLSRLEFNSITIISSDKDMMQLHKLSKNIFQYCPIKNEYITYETREFNMNEHVLKGDAIDGIPNILSDDDVFVNPDKKQKPIRKVDWQTYMDMPYKELLKTMATDKNKANFIRNLTLIDFNLIPKEIIAKINDDFDAQIAVPKAANRKWQIENELLGV